MNPRFLASTFFGLALAIPPFSYALAELREPATLEVDTAKVTRQAVELGTAVGDLNAWQVACKHTAIQKARASALDAALVTYFLKQNHNAAEAYHSAKNEGLQRGQDFVYKATAEDIRDTCEMLINMFDREMSRMECIFSVTPGANRDCVPVEQQRQAVQRPSRRQDAQPSAPVPLSEVEAATGRAIHPRALADSSPPMHTPSAPVRATEPERYPAGALPQSDTCNALPFFAKLPANTQWHVASSYSGGALTALKVPHENRAFRVVTLQVSHPGPVALALGAHDPNIWVIEQAPGTQVVAVYASGYHSQRVTGVAPSTPVVLASRAGAGGRGGCDGGYEPASLEKIIQRHSSAPIVSRTPAQPHTYIGPPQASYAQAVGSPEVEAFGVKTLLRPGREGLQDAISGGYLRLATRKEFEALPKSLQAMGPHSVYIVTKKMEMPLEMHGGNGGGNVFVVPNGVPAPSGDPGHNTLYLERQRTCVGVIPCASSPSRTSMPTTHG